MLEECCLKLSVLELAGYGRVRAHDARDCRTGLGIAALAMVISALVVHVQHEGEVLRVDPSLKRHRVRDLSAIPSKASEAARALVFCWDAAARH